MLNPENRNGGDKQGKARQGNTDGCFERDGREAGQVEKQVGIAHFRSLSLSLIVKRSFFVPQIAKPPGERGR